MLNTTKRIHPRLAAFALTALILGMIPAYADIIQPTATLPPPAGVYSIPALCITPACMANITVSGFATTSDTLSGGIGVVDTTATFKADVYQNIGGNPGGFLGAVSIGGTIRFRHLPRRTSLPILPLALRRQLSPAHQRPEARASLCRPPRRPRQRAPALL